MKTHAQIQTAKAVANNTLTAGKPLFFQPKLFVNQPNDVYEQEADAVADKVMRTADTSTQNNFFFQPVVQRKCAHCEEEEKQLQRKEAESNMPEASAETGNYISSLSGGSALNNYERNFFESRMGYDFSNVRLHTNGEANQSAKNINALAYTHGNNIVFNSNQYQPETSEGKRLLAHELTHVMQQNNNVQTLQNKLQRDGVPASASAPTTTAAPAGSTTTAPASTVNIAANCNVADVNDIITESLSWLDDIYSQLLDYDADEVFKDRIPPGSDHARVAAALQQSFHTTDLQYAEVIRRRLLNVAQLLRSPGRISINCDRSHCTSGGSSFVAAYVIGPYALTMCSVGVAGNRPVSTFIHELMHAAVPQVGISNTVTQNTGVRDRAYRGDRLYEHLSVEEALDNADSYAILAELLHARVNTQIVTPQGDTTPGCTQPDDVKESFARAAQWNLFAENALQTDLNLLHGAALSTLYAPNLDLLNHAFPIVTTTAELTALRNAFQSLQNNGFTNNWDLACATTRDRNCNGFVAYADAGKVSASAVTLRHMSTSAAIVVCSDWFTLSSDDRIKTIFAAFMLGRPSWIVNGFRLADALQYAEGARYIANETLPAPTATSAQQHIDSDERFRQQQSARKP